MKSSEAVLLLGTAILSKDILFKNTPFTSYKQPVTSSKLLENSPNKIKTRDHYITINGAKKKYMTLNGQKFLVSGGGGEDYKFSPIPPHTIIDKAKEEHDLSIFVRLLELTESVTDLENVRKDEKLITILAPNDDAFINAEFSHSKIDSLDNATISDIKKILFNHIIISDKDEFTSKDPEELEGREGIKSPGIHSVNLTRTYTYDAGDDGKTTLKSYTRGKSKTRDSAGDAEIIISTIEDPRDHIGYRMDDEREENKKINIIGWKAKLRDGSNTAILVKTDITAHDGIIHVINEVLL